MIFRGRKTRYFEEYFTTCWSIIDQWVRVLKGITYETFIIVVFSDHLMPQVHPGR